MGSSVHMALPSRDAIPQGDGRSSEEKESKQVAERHQQLLEQMEKLLVSRFSAFEAKMERQHGELLWELGKQHGTIVV